MSNIETIWIKTIIVFTLIFILCISITIIIDINYAIPILYIGLFGGLIINIVFGLLIYIKLK